MHFQNFPKPLVPELSLLSLDNTTDNNEKKNNSDSLNDFQSFNAWKWKYMNGREKIEENKSINKCNNSNNCVIIKDKYYLSETEKRKNEILYGQMDDEPRRPLPPRTFQEPPLIKNLYTSKPIMNESFIESSFNENKNAESYKKAVVNEPKENLKSDALLATYLKKEFDTSSKFYKIMTEQNNQIQILQEQIEQTLKFQDIKDKQIEQLLKLQDSKEKKIDQLLQSAEIKDKEIDRLLDIKQKQEKRLKELLKSEEECERKNAELIKKLKHLKKRETVSVSTMTDFETTDSSTNTSLNYLSEQKCDGKKETLNNSCIRVSNNFF